MHDTNVYKKPMNSLVEGLLAVACGTIVIGLPFLAWAEKWVTL